MEAVAESVTRGSDRCPLTAHLGLCLGIQTVPRSACNELLRAKIPTVQRHGKHKERGEFSAPGFPWNVLEEEKQQSKRSIRSAGSILGNVLLPGRPVNVSDHTLHHPFNALVHSIPVLKHRRKCHFLKITSHPTFERQATLTSTWQSILSSTPDR